MGNGGTQSFIVQGGLNSNGHDKMFRSRHTNSSQKCHILEKLLHHRKDISFFYHQYCTTKRWGDRRMNSPDTTRTKSKRICNLPFISSTSLPTANAKKPCSIQWEPSFVQMTFQLKRFIVPFVSTGECITLLGLYSRETVDTKDQYWKGDCIWRW
jgi:hypothetical protein